MSSKENVIREKRTIEATKKNLMGQSGKIGAIVQAYGTAIVRQGNGMADVGFLEDYYEDDVYTEYSPTVSGQNGPVAYRDEILHGGDHQLYTEGLLFDGLSRGMHLEIKWWEVTNQLIVHYKGYEVYRESAGELEGYAPFPEWEDMIDRLYKSAKNKLKDDKKIREAELGEAIKSKKKSILQQLRLRWGI